MLLARLRPTTASLKQDLILDMAPLECNLSLQAPSSSLQALQPRISSRASKLSLPITVNSLTKLASLMELTLLLLDTVPMFLRNNCNILNQVLMLLLLNLGKWV